MKNQLELKLNKLPLYLIDDNDNLYDLKIQRIQKIQNNLKIVTLWHINYINYFDEMIVNITDKRLETTVDKTLHAINNLPNIQKKLYK